MQILGSTRAGAIKFGIYVSYYSTHVNLVSEFVHAPLRLG